MKPESATGANWPEATRAAALRLAGYSFLILFFELALIRYVPAYVRIVGFYLNFVLIAAFLGMGVGLLRAQQAELIRWLALPALMLLVGAVKYFSNVFIEAPQDPNDFLWSGGFLISPNVRRIGILPVAAMLFALCSLVFVPIGALLGREFRKFPPLTAYSIDIAGSLAGIGVFALVSVLRTPPLLWFAVGLAVWLSLSWPSRRFTLSLLPTAGVVLAVVAWTVHPKPEYWSPYYRINVVPRASALAVNVNGSFHQYALDLDPSVKTRDPVIGSIRDQYLKPYALAQSPDTVLIVGAGTGNDVALLLELGAQHIDAVEIDPVILDLGRAVHVQKPYADPRVHTFVDDARAFLQKTNRRYDIIVYGTLDSHTLLSGMSSLRLDNYVYTTEAFRSAREHLKPGGTVITYHLSLQPYIAAKLFRIIARAFEAAPVVLYEPVPSLFNYTFVAGSARNPTMANAEVPASVFSDVAVPTDDWPYLYLRHRTVPRHYRETLGAVIAIALLFVLVGSRGAIRHGFDGLMFFMGAGFLLIETKSVTEMSLLFGSTWTVNLLVFASILAVILAANALVIKRPPKAVGRLFIGLFAALALAYVVPVRSLLWLNLAGKWILGGLMVALPVFFAAMIFATLFRTRTDTSRALAFNILGAVAGGVLEYSSMVIGIKALYIVALVGYAAAFLFARADAARLGSVPRVAVG